ncbi:MAG: homoserine dehydrogenase [Anaerolineaceae bacterium]|nr:MAG: homoserine dehydrogenase [Anaerolineaceae bacterium]
MKKIKIALLGFGNVGRALAQLLLEKREVLQKRYQIDWTVVGIATGRHGSVVNPAGVDLSEALSLAVADKEISSLAPNDTDIDGVAFVRMSGADVLFENTPVNYQTGQPAIDYIATALGMGMHVITANKGPVVHAFDRLVELAQTNGVRFFHESTVMDGAPIFSLWQEVLPAAKLHSFRGVLNSTSNLILTLMEAGKSFDEALAHAQAIGIAETDPSGDIMGWDAAVKVSALVTALMGIPLTPDKVDRKGIEDISLEAVIKARDVGLRWKLICQAWREGEGVEASVGPVQIDPNDSLYNVMGTSSAVTFVSDVLGDLTITETNPGPHTTAYGLLADFIRAVR